MKTSKIKFAQTTNKMEIDPSLSKYEDKAIFPEKFQKAVNFSKIWISKNGK